MQDIRKELGERLNQVREQRESLQKSIEQLNLRERQLQAVLDSEMELWNRLAPTPSLFQSSPATPHQVNDGNGTLPGLLVEFMRNGSTWALDDFKEELSKRGYPFGEKSPGRMINFALVGLVNRGLALKTPEGRWRIAE